MAFNIDKDILELEVDCFTCKEQASTVRFYKCWIFHIVKHGAIISMYFHMSKHFPTVVEIDIPNTLDRGDLSEFGNWRENEPDKSPRSLVFFRTNPHGHLYFSGHIPKVTCIFLDKSPRSLCLRYVTHTKIMDQDIVEVKLMEGATAFQSAFYVSVYKLFLQKTWTTCNLYFPIKYLLSYAFSLPKVWLYYLCLYNLPDLVEQSDSVISYDDRAVRECRGVHLINVMCVDKWTVRLT